LDVTADPNIAWLYTRLKEAIAHIHAIQEDGVDSCGSARKIELTL
jgi:hypothetical protein